MFALGVRMQRVFIIRERPNNDVQALSQPAIKLWPEETGSLG